MKGNMVNRVLEASPELLDCVTKLYLWHKYYDGQLDHCAPAVQAERILHNLGLLDKVDRKEIDQ